MSNRLVFMGVFAALSLSAPALAQDECSADADCELGFRCEVVGSSGCPAVAGCAGDECMEEPVPTCDPAPVHGCVPAPCADDTDCGDGWVCHTREFEECSAGSAGGEACYETPEGYECTEDKPEPSEEPECTTRTEQMCVPRWQLPCMAAVDCGPGFACVETESCWCSGGGATPDCAEGEDCEAPEPVETQCGCDPTGEYQCELLALPCETDADCADGLVCGDDPNGVSCGRTDSADGDTAGSDDAPDGGSDSGGSAGGGSGDAGVEDDPCADAEPARVCQPPNFGYGYGYGYAEDGRGGTVSTGGSNQDAGDGDLGGMAPPAGESAGEGSGGGGDIGLCSVSAGRQGRSGAGLLWLVPMALLLWRRRRG